MVADPDTARKVKITHKGEMLRNLLIEKRRARNRRARGFS
jgi:hypothetical protein